MKFFIPNCLEYVNRYQTRICPQLELSFRIFQYKSIKSCTLYMNGKVDVHAVGLPNQHCWGVGSPPFISSKNVHVVCLLSRISTKRLNYMNIANQAFIACK